jgi:hypothetical protein
MARFEGVPDMPKRRGGVSVLISTGFAAVALVAFWGSFVAVAHLRHTYRLRVDGTTRGYALAGYEVEVLRHSRCLVGCGARVEGPPLWTIVLVASSACPLCKGETVTWSRVFESATRSNQYEVIMITLDDPKAFAPLAQILSRRHILFRIVKPYDQRIFSIETGVLGTPTTMVIGDDKRIRFVSRGLTDLGTVMLKKTVGESD